MRMTLPGRTSPWLPSRIATAVSAGSDVTIVKVSVDPYAERGLYESGGTDTVGCRPNGPYVSACRIDDRSRYAHVTWSSIAAVWCGQAYGVVTRSASSSRSAS